MIVKQDLPFSIVPNATLENTSLSFKAKGILSYLLSRPPAFRLTVRRLSRASTEGRTAIATALAELERAGLLRRVETPEGGPDWQISDGSSAEPLPVAHSGPAPMEKERQRQ